MKDLFSIPIINPRNKEFKEHNFNDTKGRINKGRLWFAVNITRNEKGESVYELHIWKKLLFELCSEEFTGDFEQGEEDLKKQIWTDAGESVYGSEEKFEREKSKFKLDGVNSSRAYELDLCYMVDWDTGKWGMEKNDFPLKGKWEEIKKNFKKIFEIFMGATKGSVHCLSSSKDQFDENFKWGCFQYFGMDFIIDEQAKVWLLEFNTRPWIGYGNWWRQNFDKDNIHLNDKWTFIESMLRRFVTEPAKIYNPVFHEITKPYFVDGKDQIQKNNMDHWEILLPESGGEKITIRNLNEPIAIASQVIPITGLPNWVLNREWKNNLKSMGWNMFPFVKLIKNPKLIFQGMTPLLNYLTTQDNFKEEDIAKSYPDLLRANIINRIFPLVVYLGNKAKLVERLKNTYPDEWNSIIPFSFTINKQTQQDWKNIVRQNTQVYNSTWIVKPSLGLQGKGIKISKDIESLITHMENSEENEWVISYYIDPPYLVEGRKNHIRVFVLVHRNKQGYVNIYLMNRHLIFLAGHPYNEDFGEYFKKYKLKDEVKVDFFEYKNLTNLAKGSDFLKKYTTASKDFKKDKNFGYKILSGDAKEMINLDNSEGYYEKHLEPQIINIVDKTINAVGSDITCIQEGESTFEGCYHYVAFDIMFDKPENDNPHAWLLEVNVNPGLKALTDVLGKKDGGMGGFLRSIINIVDPDTSKNRTNIRQIRTKKKYRKDKKSHQAGDVIEYADGSSYKHPIDRPHGYKKKDCKLEPRTENGKIKGQPIMKGNTGDCVEWEHSILPGKKDEPMIYGEDIKGHNKGDVMKDVNGNELYNENYYIIPPELKEYTQKKLEEEAEKTRAGRLKIYRKNVFIKINTLDFHKNKKIGDIVTSSYLANMEGINTVETLNDSPSVMSTDSNVQFVSGRNTDSNGRPFWILEPPYRGTQFVNGNLFFDVINRGYVRESDFLEYRSRWDLPLFGTSLDLVDDIKKEFNRISRIKGSNTKEGSCYGSCVCNYSKEELEDIIDNIDIKGIKKFKRNKDQMCAVLTYLNGEGVINITMPYTLGWNMIDYNRILY